MLSRTSRELYLRKKRRRKRRERKRPCGRHLRKMIGPSKGMTCKYFGNVSVCLCPNLLVLLTKQTSLLTRYAAGRAAVC